MTVSFSLAVFTSDAGLLNHMERGAKKLNIVKEKNAELCMVTAKFVQSELSLNHAAKATIKLPSLKAVLSQPIRSN